MSSRRADHERGAAILEFALVAIVLYLLIAASLDLGRQMLYAQTAQGAANLLARELSLVELPVTGVTLSDLLESDATVNAAIYDPRRLVIDLDNDLAPGQSLDDFFATLPVVNRSLRALMIFDPVTDGGVERRLLRVPGALWVLPDGSLTVKVPRVVSRAADGTETIEIEDFVTEVRNAAGNSVFPVDPNDPLATGLVAVRLNVPFQAAAISGFGDSPDGPFEPNLDEVHAANDAGVAVQGAAIGAPAGFDALTGTYSGPYGLGEQQALGKVVRPYRKLITVDAVFRREGFAP